MVRAMLETRVASVVAAVMTSIMEHEWQWGMAWRWSVLARVARCRRSAWTLIAAARVAAIVTTFVIVNTVKRF